MIKYVDAKIRFCPNCNLNIKECTCQKQQVKFFKVTKEKFDKLVEESKLQEE